MLQLDSPDSGWFNVSNFGLCDGVKAIYIRNHTWDLNLGLCQACVLWLRPLSDTGRQAAVAAGCHLAQVNGKHFPLTIFCFVKKNYLKEQQRCGNRELPSPQPLVYSPNAAVAGSGPGLEKELEIQPSSPIAGTQLVESTHLPPRIWNEDEL